MSQRDFNTIRVTGLKELQAALKRVVGGGFEKALGLANKQFIDKGAVPRIRSAAPVQTGALRRSVRGSKSARNASVMIGTETRVPYAGPINFGWPSRNIAAQEFIYSSLQHEGDWENAYIEHLDKLLSEAFPEGSL